MNRREPGPDLERRGPGQSWRIKCLVLMLQVISVGSDLSPRQQTENFFQLLTKNEVDKAYEGLLAGSVVLGDKKPQMEQMKNRLKAGLPSLGKAVDYELVAEKPAGSSISHLTYIFRFERQPLLCDFYFYRPYDRWMIDEFTINASFAAPAPKHTPAGTSATPSPAKPSPKPSPGKSGKGKSTSKPTPAKP
jgi:hypothetical protein